MRRAAWLAVACVVSLLISIDASAQDWSPNGAWLVVSSDVLGIPQVFAVRADGSDVRQLTTGPLESRSPVWSHDGKSIVCYQGHGWVPPLPRGQQWFDIVALDWPGGGQARKLTEGRGYDTNPASAPGDGRCLF